MKTWLVLEIFLTEDSKVEDLLCGAPSCSEACLFFSNDLLRLRLKSVQYYLQHDCLNGWWGWSFGSSGIAAGCLFLWSVMTKDWVHGVCHWPVYQTLLQIVVRAGITSSPPAWISSAGMSPSWLPFLQWLYCRLHFFAKDRVIVHYVCLGTGQYLWVSNGLVIDWPYSSIKVVAQSHTLKHNQKFNCTEHLNNWKSWNTHARTQTQTQTDRQKHVCKHTLSPSL